MLFFAAAGGLFNFTQIQHKRLHIELIQPQELLCKTHSFMCESNDDRTTLSLSDYSISSLPIQHTVKAFVNFIYCILKNGIVCLLFLNKKKIFF